VYAVRLVTKAQIVGHWIAIKTNNLSDTMTKMILTEIISSTAIATIATKKAIKKLTTHNTKKNVEEWIGDTGATCHMKSNTNGMYGLEKCKGNKIDSKWFYINSHAHWKLQRKSAVCRWDRKRHHHEEC